MCACNTTPPSCRACTRKKAGSRRKNARCASFEMQMCANKLHDDHAIADLFSCRNPRFVKCHLPDIEEDAANTHDPALLGHHVLLQLHEEKLDTDDAAAAEHLRVPMGQPSASENKHASFGALQQGYVSGIKKLETMRVRCIYHRITSIRVILA